MYLPLQSLVSQLVSPEGHPVPLLGVAVSGEVFGAQARIFVRQRYRNRESKPIEAIYTFPLPSDAVLVGFAMECEGRRLEGEVKEREEAFQAYDEAVTRGHGAALLDQERRNVFTASVGNLLPGEETVIEVAYIQRLGADEGALRLMIPTLVAPRYMPGTPEGDRTGHGAADPTDRVPDADRISPKIGAVKYGLAIDIEFDVGRDVQIESPSHDIQVTVAGGPNDGGHKRRVKFQRKTVPLDRDLVLLAAGAEGVSAGVVAERQRGKDGTFALTVVPDLFQQVKRAPAKDVVFVVDVSGSMAGESIEQAKTALRLCLRHLAEGDEFQIIAFSNTFRSFQGGLVPFTQRSLQDADAWVGALAASGGTEMLGPLLAATSALSQGERWDEPRGYIIVLLTDGQVGNESEIIEKVTASSGAARIYTFGIGTNVSDLLLRDLARRSKGEAEFIYPGERIDAKVTAQFARAAAARVENLSLWFTNVDAGELAPSDLPPLIDGEPWVVFGRYTEPGIGRAELRGTLLGEKFFLEVPIELPAEATREGLAALWAAARIRDLEDAEGSLAGRRAESNKKRIAALSVEHQVASKYASFLVVEKRTGDRRAQGQPEARPVPVNGPAGWSMGPSMDEGAAFTGAVTRAGTIKPGGGWANQVRAAASAGMAPAGMRASAPRAAAAMASWSGGPPPAMMPPPPGARVAPSAPTGGAFSPPPGFESRSPMGPPPMPASPMPAAPRPANMESRCAPPPPAARKGLVGSVMGAVSGLFSKKGEAADGAQGAPPTPMAPPPAMEEAMLYRDPAAASPAGPAGRGAAASDPTALLERQLASGLWEGSGGTDAARLLATAQALAACFEAQIDSAHPTFGAQIRKAVEAVCRLAGELAKKGEAGREVKAALAAAFLVASGRRLRGQVAAAANDGGDASLKAFVASLTDADAAKGKLAELGVS
jgi:Ca-activated chloride channel family protein